jgi:NAD(P)-dependent dehydrogenase (short-subunit alcohol dehydrogenase family)
MTGKFGETSTTDEVLDGVDLSGKRILVTGVSAGLGVETARTLAAHGGQVVGAARDLNKAKAATEQVRAQARRVRGDAPRVTSRHRKCPNSKKSFLVQSMSRSRDG